MLTVENKMKTTVVMGAMAVSVFCGLAKADSISDGQYLELSTWLFGHERQVTGMWGVEPWDETDKHAGVDYGAPEGTQLFAATDGEVIRVERGSSVALSTLSIYHAGTKTSFIYLHMETIEVAVSDKIQAGSFIGTVGKRGEATGPHIHFEARAGWRTHAAKPYNDTVKNPYQAARSARTASASPLSNIFTIDNRTGAGFRIEAVSSTFSGVFAQGVDVTNTITAQVDWGWRTPSRVIFTLNNISRTVHTGGAMAQTNYNMGQDLNYSLAGTKNELKVQAIAANGSQSQIYVVNLWGLSLPEWAVSVENKIVPINSKIDSTGKLAYYGKVEFFKKPDEKQGGTASIPEGIPRIGGEYGIEMNPLTFNWELAARAKDGHDAGLTGTLDLSGTWGATAKFGQNRKGTVEATLGGVGEFYPAFRLKEVSANLASKFQFDLPKIYMLCAWTGCCIDPCPYGYMSLRPEISGTIKMEQGEPALVAGMKFSEAELLLSMLVQGRVGSDGKRFYKVEGGIGGKPTLILQFPKNPDSYCLNEYIKEIKFVVILDASVSVLFFKANWSTVFDIYECPTRGTMQIMSMETIRSETPQVISRDYLNAEEGYCVFPSIDDGMMRPMAVGGLPEPILNVGPMPVPSVAATTDKGLLVFVYDDANKPTGKHMEIYFARWDGDQWTQHAPITDNYKVDTDPVAIIDENGTELVVWMQAPEISGTEEGPEDIIGGFEIVWSKYDAISGTWQIPMNLSNNNYADVMPWFDRSVTGQLRACWIASPTNAIALWDDDDISPLVKLMAADWDGSTFGLPYMIAENLVTAAPPAIGRTDTHEILAYLKDHDNNSATNEDVEVVVRTRPLGGSWSDDVYLTFDEKIANIAVDIAVDAYGMPIVIWTKRMVMQVLPDGEEISTDQVWFSAFVEDFNGGGYIWTEPELAFEYPGISEPTLFRNEAGKIVLYWTALSDDFVDIYYSVLDANYMMWSAAQQITFDQDVETMISVTESGGNILAAFVKRRIDMSDPVIPPQIGLSDIHLLEHIPSRDLSITAEDIQFSPAISNDLAAFVEYWLDQDCDEPDWCGGFDLDQSGNVDLVDFVLFSDVFYSDVYPQPGRYTKVFADVYLAGDFTTHDIVVHFYDGDPDDGGELIGTDTIDVMFPGNKHTAQMLWFVPEDKVNIELYVVVDPDNQIEEDNKANNVAFAQPLKADLVARSVQVMGSPGVDQVIIGFTVENRGNTAAENFTCQIRKDTEDGVILFSGQIDRINAGQTSGSQFVWDVSAEDADFKTLVLIVDTENTVDEIDENNNVISRQLPVFADLVAEQWSAEIEGISAAILVRNAGPKPSLPTVVQVIRNELVIGETAIGGLLSGESVEVEISLSEEVNYGRATFSVNPEQVQDEMTFENNTVEKIILISADFSGSGTVGLDDLLILAHYWLQDEPSVDIAPPGGDGIINLLDFAYMAELWLLASE